MFGFFNVLNSYLNHMFCQVFLSLTFDEDIGKSDVLKEPVKPKKRGKWKNQDSSKEVQGSDRKKNKQELMKKTREEVFYD